jgi:hypothetical protein
VVPSIGNSAHRVSELAGESARLKDLDEWFAALVATVGGGSHFPHIDHAASEAVSTVKHAFVANFGRN